MIRQRLGLLALILFALACLMSACDAGLAGTPGGGLGATPGGVQDMGFARELIANGQVPPAEAFVVEGMFSEHDLPLTGAACSRILCLRSAAGIAPTLEGNASGWLQVGMSSTINPDEFERPSLSLIFVVDVSGSMNWQYQTPYNEYQTPLKVAKLQMQKLVPQLNAQDKVAIVIYGSDSKTVLNFIAGSEQQKILKAIDDLESEGSTNMEAGLKTAFQLMKSANGTDEKRLMLFTDVQPNVGATGATEFQELVSEGASLGAGLTVFGVGVGLGAEVFSAMSKLRGGNAFTLFGSRDVDKIVEEDWPYMVSPIAYDLKLELLPAAGFEVAEGYGFPTANKEAKLDVSTVFLSKRRGGLLVRFNTEQSVTTFAVDAALSYTTPEGLNLEENLSANTTGQTLDNRGHFYAQASVGKTVALAILVSSMNQAATLYGSDAEAAISLLEKARLRFQADAEALADSALMPEVKLTEDLLQLMKDGAEQGTLYGN